MSAEVTYKTHILIGVRANGVKTVIADWSHVPKQAEVLQEIQKAGNGYSAFALCTPTSRATAAPAAEIGTGAGSEELITVGKVLVVAVAAHSDVWKSTAALGSVTTLSRARPAA